VSLRDELGEGEYERCVRVWRAYCARERLTWKHAAMCIRLNGGKR
jgi:hypothetical protein